MRPVGIALVHYPVLARDGTVVTTAITNLDIHDIARTSYTYDIAHYFLVHPVLAQRNLAMRVVSHWTQGSGAKRIPDRKPPMETVCVVESLAQAAEALGDSTQIWVTSAQQLPDHQSHHAARHLLEKPGPPVLLVFGTGWGLAEEVVLSADLKLSPIRSTRADGYNHLSVRAAVAILLDRLLASPDWGSQQEPTM